MTGALIGAALGLEEPGLGNLIGGAIGAALGTIIGGTVGYITASHSPTVTAPIPLLWFIPNQYLTLN